MSQLLIIDVQNTYIKHIPGDLISELPFFSKNFSEVLFLWDNISGQEFYDEIPEEWLYEENEDFYNRLNSFTKNYAFIRGFMDIGIPDDEIVELGKFMLKNNIYDGRDITNNEDILSLFNEKFKNSSFYNTSFDDYTFYLPDDLIDEFQSRLKNGVTIVGGGVNECLKEVCLLLRMLDIEFKVAYEFTY